jgi:hypothetical protein
MNFFRQRALSAAASELIEFDADSIRRLGSPDVWLVDPDGYEKNGRILRDTDSPRMLAYSTKDHLLYATDGCNSCTRRLPTDLEQLSPEDLKQFAEDNELRLELFEGLVALLRSALRADI